MDALADIPPTPEQIARAKIVTRRASCGRSPAAKTIRGAINDVYERSAHLFLVATQEQAREKGMSDKEHEEQAVIYLQLAALEALQRSINASNNTPRRNRLRRRAL